MFKPSHKPPDATVGPRRSDGFKKRWSDRLNDIAQSKGTGFGGWVPVVRSFLRLYSRLGARDSDNMTSIEAMLIIHVMDNKWTSQSPTIDISAMADQMGIKMQQVKRHIRSLRSKFGKDLIVYDKTKRQRHKRKCWYKFHLNSLFERIANAADQRIAAKKKSAGID